jgi:hypothetical protein
LGGSQNEPNLVQRNGFDWIFGGLFLDGFVKEALILSLYMYYQRQLT